MPATLLFCTSEKITSEIVRNLQLQERASPIPLNPFSPARHSAKDQIEPSKNAVEDQFDIFEDATDSHLRDFLDARQEGNRWLEADRFAVLDDRSAEDETVVIHYLNTEVNDLGDILGRSWVKWRVTFADSYEMIGLLMTTPEIVERVFMSYDKFIGEDGIFRMREAFRVMGYGE